MQKDPHPPPEVFKPKIDYIDCSQEMKDWQETGITIATLHVHDTMAILLLGVTHTAFKHDGKIDPIPFRDEKTSCTIRGSGRPAFALLGYLEPRRQIAYQPGMFPLLIPDRDHYRRQLFQLRFERCMVWDGDWKVHSSIQHTNAPKWDISAVEIEVTPYTIRQVTSDWKTQIWTMDRGYMFDYHFNARREGMTISCTVWFSDYNHITLSVYKLEFDGDRIPIAEYVLVRKAQRP